MSLLSLRLLAIGGALILIGLIVGLGGIVALMYGLSYYASSSGGTMTATELSEAMMFFILPFPILGILMVLSCGAGFILLLIGLILAAIDLFKSKEQPNKRRQRIELSPPPPVPAEADLPAYYQKKTAPPSASGSISLSMPTPDKS